MTWKVQRTAYRRGRFIESFRFSLTAVVYTTMALLLLPVDSFAAQAAGEKVTYYYTDPQGTVLATTDAAGNITSTSDYRPYGAQALGTPQAAPGYTGHVNDPDSGLVYMQARYYDPDTSRFLTVDPKIPDAGNLANFARFSYASGNPIRYVDLDGKQSWCTPGNCGAQNYLAVAQQASYIKNNFDLVAEVKGAVGLGIEATYNVSRNQGDINLHPVAQGAEASLYFQPKNSLVIPLVDNPKNGKMAISWGGSADFAAGVKTGVDVKFDPGGKIELTPKLGVGLGEFQQYAPSINLFHWENNVEDTRKTSLL